MSTFNRNTLVKVLEILDSSHAQEALAAAKLASAMVREAGTAPDDFDAARWFARWMADPVPALGGVAPQELLDTADGREAVSTLLYQMKSGVYA